jgi:sugar lactone lactonase YvrE
MQPLLQTVKRRDGTRPERVASGRPAPLGADSRARIVSLCCVSSYVQSIHRSLKAMRSTALRTRLALLVTIVAAGCGYDSTSPYPPPPPPPNPTPQDGLWTAAGTSSSILRLAPDQLSGTGSRPPATAITTPSAPLFFRGTIAFDPSGTMWIASQEDSVLLAFAPDALTSSGSRAATKVIMPVARSLSGPTGLAFDSQHRLWVANRESGTLVRFDPGQLTTGGAPIPAVILSGLANPTALAFDAAGSLWVSNNHLHAIAKFSAAQLATSASPTPTVVLSSTGSSLVNPNGLAFDASGNLWVANSSADNLVAFSPAQQVASGAPEPHITISSVNRSVPIPVGLAFDADGSLWVVGGAGDLMKFASTSLSTSGAPEPSARLILTGQAILWTAAFWPRPAGLPLN